MTTTDEEILQSYPTMPLDPVLLDNYTSACIAKGVKYGYGDKDPVLGAFPPDFILIDCSGFLRTAFYYATNKKIRLPDGSFNEGTYLDANKYKRSDFKSTGLVDGVVRVGVYHNSGGIGHAFAVRNGKTYESCGSEGVCHRPWNCETMTLISPHTTYWAVA